MVKMDRWNGNFWVITKYFQQKIIGLRHLINKPGLARPTTVWLWSYLTGYKLWKALFVLVRAILNRINLAVTLSKILLHGTQMAMRSVFGRSSLTPSTVRAAGVGGFRFLSDGKGRVLSEEERAAENVYIQVELLDSNVREKNELKSSSNSSIDLLCWMFSCWILVRTWLRSKLLLLYFLFVRGVVIYDLVVGVR